MKILKFAAFGNHPQFVLEYGVLLAKKFERAFQNNKKFYGRNGPDRSAVGLMVQERHFPEKLAGTERHDYFFRKIKRPLNAHRDGSLVNNEQRMRVLSLLKNIFSRLVTAQVDGLYQALDFRPGQRREEFGARQRMIEGIEVLFIHRQLFHVILLPYFDGFKKSGRSAGFEPRKQEPEKTNRAREQRRQ